MAVTIVCPHCQKRASVAEEHLGKRAQCPACGKRIVLEAVPDEARAGAGAAEAAKPSVRESPAVPPRAAASAAETTSTSQTAPVVRTSAGRSKPTATASPAVATAPPPKATPSEREILAALEGEFIRPRYTVGYGAAMMLVALMMVLLPVIYVAVIIAVGYGAWWHLVNNHTMLQVQARGKGYLLVVLAYVAPAFIALVLIAFMIKPLIARRQETRRGRLLKRDEEPLLFAFVDRLCDLIGSPRPQEIEVNLDVNAYAALQGRFLGGLFSRRVQLGIGLPLVQGMTLPQFAGVLAHEFGHFSQFAGMRLGRVIRQINGWFAEVVYHRDAWDERLVEWSHVDMRVSWVVYLARGFVWLTRKLLQGLMFVGHAVSCRLARQMEFDADRYEVRLVGPEVFAQTSRKFAIMAVADQWGWSSLRKFFDEGKLVANQPQLVLEVCRRADQQALAEIVASELAIETGWFDTHPSTADRIANAQADGSPGLLHLDAPATALFRNFDALAESVTREHYEQSLDRPVRPEELVAVESLFAQQKETQDLYNAMYQFALGAAVWRRPLLPPQWTVTAATDPEAAWKRLLQARRVLQQQRPKMLRAIKELNQAWVNRDNVHRLWALLQSELSSRQKVGGLPVTTIKEAKAAQAQLEPEWEAAAAALEPYESIVGGRLHTALQLVEQPQFAAQLPEGTSLAQINAWLAAVQRMATALPALENLDVSQERLAGHLQMLRGNHGKDERVINGAVREAKRLRGAVMEAREKFLAVPYSFPHTNPKISVGEYALPAPLETDHPEVIESAAAELVRCVLDVHLRMLGRLARIAVAIEAAGGLEPIEFDDPDEAK